MPRIYFGTRALRGFSQGSVLTIGAFDGVHRGHQSIIARLVEKSAELELPSVAVTFYPDPVLFFRPETAPPQIMSWREKAAALLDAGVQAVVCLRFNESVRRMSAESFGRDILAEQLGARFVIVGDDFRFGQGREGNVEALTRLGLEYGFAVEQSGTYQHKGERISSTRIRHLLNAGCLSGAAELLGKPYEVCGRVVQVRQRGDESGAPIATVPLRRSRMPISGFYAVRAEVDGHWYKAAANLGYRPARNTLSKPLLEIHMLDFEGELWGKRVRVRFEKKIRDEQNVDDLDQLKIDVEKARAWFGSDPDRALLIEENETE